MKNCNKALKKKIIFRFFRLFSIIALIYAILENYYNSLLRNVREQFTPHLINYSKNAIYIYVLAR